MSTFIQLGGALLINTQSITYIDRLHTGAKIHFVGGGSLEINVPFEQVMSDIKNLK